MEGRQFSLRAILLAMTGAAVVMFLATNPRLVSTALAAGPSAFFGGVIGAIAGRIIGTDRIDSIIGGTLGAMAGTFVWSLLPAIE